MILHLGMPILVKFFKYGPKLAAFCLFSSFSKYNDNIGQNLTLKAQKVCLGFESGTAGWKARTNPRIGQPPTNTYEFIWCVSY